MHKVKQFLLAVPAALFSLISYGQLSTEEQHLVDSLKKITESNAPDTTRLDAYLEWDNLIYFYDPELDQQLNETVVTIARENLEKGNLTRRETELYYKAKGMAQNNLALVQIDFGNYYDALYNLQESLEIAEYFNDSMKIANCYNNIGMIYKYMNMNEKAMELYDKSIDYTAQDHYSLSTYFNNIGICYFDMGDPERALESYDLSIAYADSCGDLSVKGNTLANIGLIKISQKKYREAIEYFERSIPVYEAISDVVGLAFAYKNLGISYYDLGEAAKAIDLCSKGLEIASDAHALEPMKESCECLYLGYKKQGNVSKALYFLEEFRNAKDSLQSTEKSEELMRLDFQFNSERRHMADSLEFANASELQKINYETSMERKQKTQYVLFAGIGILLVFGVILLLGYQRKKKDNAIIAQQKHEVEEQKQIVEAKNKEITDSINYARRIQEAILPDTSYFQSHFQNSFILYRPKDIVAGDFYWLEEASGKLVFAVADCTGHGVPGAMVSVVCHNALNRSVNEFGLLDPGKILDKTRELVLATFEREIKTGNQENTTIRDGMDIALCVLDKSNYTLNYAGANNGLYLIRDKKMEELSPDKQPIGKYAEEKPFQTKSLKLKQGDTIYLYSDGFADQFGGPEGKKYKYKQLKNLLLSINELSPAEQMAKLNQDFDSWKGKLEQVDDVCIMGIKL